MVQKVRKTGRTIINQEVGLRVRAVREHLKRTQDDVAKAIGLQLLAYGTKERGQRPFYIDELLKVSEVLGVDITYLLRGGSRNPQQLMISEVSVVLKDVEEKLEMVQKMVSETEAKTDRDLPSWVDELNFTERTMVEKFLDSVQQNAKVGKYRENNSLSI